MVFPPVPILGSIDAARPVFLIVMGISLVIFTWRLAAGAADWPARLMVMGSLMLGAGYALLLPAYEAGLIPSINDPYLRDPASAIGWHAVRLVLMNTGWLVFGIGLAMHAKVLPHPAPRKVAVVRHAGSPPTPAHESIV